MAFPAPLVDPVVFAQVMTDNDPDPAMVRIRNVTDTGFEMRVDEWNYQDGIHGTETVGWMAIEKGEYAMSEFVIWGGLNKSVPMLYAFWMEIDTIEANHVPEVIGDDPLVAAQSQTRNGGATQTIRKGPQGLFVQEEEAADGIHAAEEVGLARVGVSVDHL